MKNHDLTIRHKMLSFGNTLCAAQRSARPKSSFPFYEKLYTYVSPRVSDLTYSFGINTFTWQTFHIDLYSCWFSVPLQITVVIYSIQWTLQTTVHSSLYMWYVSYLFLRLRCVLLTDLSDSLPDSFLLRRFGCCKR